MLNKPQIMVGKVDPLSLATHTMRVAKVETIDGNGYGYWHYSDSSDGHSGSLSPNTFDGKKVVCLYDLNRSLDFPPDMNTQAFPNAYVIRLDKLIGVKCVNMYYYFRRLTKNFFTSSDNGKDVPLYISMTPPPNQLGGHWGIAKLLFMLATLFGGLQHEAKRNAFEWRSCTECHAFNYCRIYQYSKFWQLSRIWLPNRNRAFWIDNSRNTWGGRNYLSFFVLHWGVWIVRNNRHDLDDICILILCYLCYADGYGYICKVNLRRKTFIYRENTSIFCRRLGENNTYRNRTCVAANAISLKEVA